MCRRGQVPPPVESFAAQLGPMTPAILDGALGPGVVGESEACRAAAMTSSGPTGGRRADGDRQHL
jgi:hypothetical protein